MDWRKFISKKYFKYGVSGVGIIGICGLIAFSAKPVSQEFQSSFAYQEFQKYGIFETYQRHYYHFIHELKRLANSEQREESLVNELALTRRDLELERARSAEVEIQNETRMVAQQLKKNTGSALARTPKVIQFQVPEQLAPHELFVMGMEYFRSHQYEKSAVVFQKLINSNQEYGIRFPEFHLVGAISWYHVHNYEMALKALKEIQSLKMASGSTLRQSMLWQAMVEKKLGKYHSSQETLEKLVATHAQSEEVLWINGTRKPANAKKSNHSPIHSDQHGGSSHE